MEKRFVYADNAATTRVSDEVVAAMLPYFTEYYGNPSAVYGFAGKAKTAIENARAQVAAALGATPGEIYFVSCGTEADNWALKGTARMLAEKGLKLWKMYKNCTIVTVVCLILAFVPILGILAAIVAFIAAIVLLVAGILYIIFLYQAQASLQS